jgi:hypothetical protein
MSLRDRRRRQRIADPVPTKPFLTWFADRVLAYERRGDEDARARALTGIGWDDDAGQRRLIRWQSWWVREKGKLRVRGDFVARTDVEDALACAGVRMWELVASRTDDAVCTQRAAPVPRRHGRPGDVLAYIDATLAATYTPQGHVHCELRQRLLLVQRAEYVEDEPDARRSHCSLCVEDVPTDEKGACLWCGEITEAARVQRAFAMAGSA